jgi:hypothetical protein
LRSSKTNRIFGRVRILECSILTTLLSGNSRRHRRRAALGQMHMRAGKRRCADLHGRAVRRIGRKCRVGSMSALIRFGRKRVRYAVTSRPRIRRPAVPRSARD